MYAIIADGGRQYRVESGQVLDIDYRDVGQGDQIEFSNVLLVSGEEGVQLGKPRVESAKVTATVTGVKLGPKLIVQKFRRRKNSRRRNGHRQMYTTVQIEEISL